MFVRWRNICVDAVLCIEEILPLVEGMRLQESTWDPNIGTNEKNIMLHVPSSFYFLFSLGKDVGLSDSARNVYRGK